jgi:hypothetical protein
MALVSRGSKVVFALRVESLRDKLVRSNPLSWISLNVEDVNGYSLFSWDLEATNFHFFCETMGRR